MPDLLCMCGGFLVVLKMLTRRAPSFGLNPNLNKLSPRERVAPPWSQPGLRTGTTLSPRLMKGNSSAGWRRCAETWQVRCSSRAFHFFLAHNVSHLPSPCQLVMDEWRRSQEDPCFPHVGYSKFCPPSAVKEAGGTGMTLH